MALRDSRHPSCNSYPRITLCLTEIMLLLSRQTIAVLDKRSAPRRGGNWALVQKALFRIREAYSQPLTINSLARQLGTTPQTLIRQFRGCVGSSPLQRLTETRMEHARELMKDPSLSLKEIARAVGIRDAAEFSRWFRRQEGCSPRSSRKKLVPNSTAPM